MRSSPSGFQVRVFGALADPQDPTLMIRVEYAESQSMAIPCHSFLSLPMPDGAVAYTAEEWTDAATPIAGATPFAVAATTGSFCSDPSGLLQAGWFTENIGVSLSAGTGVSPTELVQFAQSLKSVPLAESLQGRPSVDLVSDPLPAGRTVLVGEDVPFTQQVTETSWVATVGGVDGVAGQLNVQTWQGADEQGVYAKHAPIQAQRITIRGHDGYVYASAQQGDNGPLEVEIWWTEAPGLAELERELAREDASGQDRGVIFGPPETGILGWTVSALPGGKRMVRFTAAPPAAATASPSQDSATETSAQPITA